MTMPQPAPAAAPPQYVPPPGSRIEALLDQREAAKAAVKEAEARVDAINAAIQAELTAMYPGERVIGIAAGQYRPALRMRWVTPTKLDTKALRQANPAICEAFTVWGTPYWEIRKAGS